MSIAAERLHVLLLSADPLLVTTFTDISQEFGIEAHSSSATQHAAEQLAQSKYEGVLIDFDTVSEARPIFAAARQSPSNKNAVLFAVASHVTNALGALDDRVQFLLRRPLDKVNIKQALCAAYVLMRRERRRYFRCLATLPVRLRAGPKCAFQCLTINVSSNGLAINSPVPQTLGTPVDLELQLPDGFTVQGNGAVIWDDKHGKTGIHFHSATPEMQTRLDEWLDTCVSEQMD
jgi:PilZ domain-containing protein